MKQRNNQKEQEGKREIFFKDYLKKPSVVTRKRIGGKEYVIRSFFTGNKPLDEIITQLAVRKAYDDLNDGIKITLQRENRFDSGGKK